MITIFETWTTPFYIELKSPEVKYKIYALSRPIIYYRLQADQYKWEGLISNFGDIYIIFFCF